MNGRTWINRPRQRAKPGTESHQTRESKQRFPGWNRYVIPPSAITAVKPVGAEMCQEFRNFDPIWRFAGFCGTNELNTVPGMEYNGVNIR